MGSLTAHFDRVACDLYEKGKSEEFILQRLEELSVAKKIWRNYPPEKRRAKFLLIVNAVTFFPN